MYVTTLEYFTSAVAFVGEPLFGFLPVFCFKHKPSFSNNNTLNKYSSVIFMSPDWFSACILLGRHTFLIGSGAQKTLQCLYVPEYCEQ
jgi:hypothetical protein